MLKNKKEELIKLVQENPNLPLVFIINNSEIASDYYSTVMGNFYPYKSEVYKYEVWGDLVWSDDKEEVIEFYQDEFANNEEYKDLSDEEYFKKIEEYVDENIEHFEAIVLSVS